MHALRINKEEFLEIVAYEGMEGRVDTKGRVEKNYVINVERERMKGEGEAVGRVKENARNVGGRSCGGEWRRSM